METTIVYWKILYFARAGFRVLSGVQGLGSGVEDSLLKPKPTKPLRI